MPWETFHKSQAPGNLRALKESIVAISKVGHFRISGPALEVLGQPRAVELLYDRECQHIGFKPSSPDNKRSWIVTRPKSARSGIVTANTMLKHYKIPYKDRSRRYPAHLEDGVLVIDLNEELQEGG